MPFFFKLALKGALYKARLRFVRAFMSYDAARLRDTLRALGLRDGDSVMLHSGYAPHYGFTGSIGELINAFVDTVGPQGNLLMVSMAYRSSALEYLQRLKCFDVRRTPSMMGLVSEMFRRRPEVLRSLNPMHPVLARGPRARWFVEGHERCIHSCGPDSPFERLAQVDGKAVFLDVPFAVYTMFHYLEHLLRDELPFALYSETPLQVPVIAEDGREISVRTCVYPLDTIRRRRFQVLEDAMRERGLLHRRRVGNSRLLLVRVRDTVDCVRELAARGRYFYDLSDIAAPAGGRPANEGMR